MAKKQKNKEPWFKRSTRLVSMHPSTFEESRKLLVTNGQLLSIIILILLFLSFLNYLLFAFTPFSFLLPDNVKISNNKDLQNTAIKVKELEHQVNLQEQYITNLQHVILGETSIDSVFHINESDVSSVNQELTLTSELSEEELELERNIKVSEERIKQNQQQDLSHLFLFDPIVGKISQRFKIPNHLGVDIIATKDTQIKACLEGIVLHAAYNSKDGHIIIISHKNNLISIYKHASTVHVKVGDHVRTGESIGVIGSSGENSTGEHLHFELWNEKGPLNPLSYFSFGK